MSIKAREAAAFQISLEDKHREITEHKLALQQIIYDTHHRGLNPLFKTMRGLVNLVRLVTPKDSVAHEYLNKLDELILKSEDEWINRIKPFENM